MAYKKYESNNWYNYTSPKIDSEIKKIRDRINKHLSKKYPKVIVEKHKYNAYQNKYFIVISKINKSDVDLILKYLKRIEKDSIYFMKSSRFWNDGILIEIG